MLKTLILIPSRMSATRLPGKPLLEIAGISIVSRVFKIAEETNIGDVCVATEDQEILDDVKKNGGNAILTTKAKTGSDRIFEAYKKINPLDVDYILNIQGDEPFIDKKDLTNLNKKGLEQNSEIATLGCKIEDNDIYKNENIVKVKTANEININNFSKALNFYRKIENLSKKNTYHHVGVYLYKVSALKKFISLEQTKNEKTLKLEQLRALDNNISIDVFFSNTAPLGIDTREDYLRAKNLLETKN